MERANLPRQMHAAVLVGPDQLELQEGETPRPGRETERLIVTPAA